MEVSESLLSTGINESILEFFHSRTNNKDMTIIKASKSSSSTEDQNIRVLITLKSVDGYLSCVEYTMNLAKIRQKRINLLLIK
jgi:hypothetical protein